MVDPLLPTGFNQRIGLNLQGFRKSAGLSQAELAQALASRGAPFQQQTILKVEKGTRPLKLEEASLIAEILTVSVADLLTTHNAALDQLINARARRERLTERRADVARQLEQLDQELQAALQEEWEAQGRFHATERDH